MPQLAVGTTVVDAAALGRADWEAAVVCAGVPGVSSPGDSSRTTGDPRGTAYRAGATREGDICAGTDAT